MRTLIVIAAALAVGGCASLGSNEPDPVQLRLNALEAENQSLREQLAEQKRILDGMGAVGLGSSVAGLEEKLRMLRGQIEELNYKLERQQERQRALYVDLDERLRRLEGGESASPGGLNAPAEDDNADQKAYLAAFQQLKSGQYGPAIQGFEKLMARYPESPYAPNAQYWIGEAHYVQREFDAAWQAFARVLERFPASSKAPDALLKQGLLRVEQGRQKEARQLLRQVPEKFPNSSAADLARERLRQMGEG